LKDNSHCNNGNCVIATMATTPTQQWQIRQHNKGDNASAKNGNDASAFRAMTPSQ
jgi:hypothetical protein